MVPASFVIERLDGNPIALKHVSKLRDQEVAGLDLALSDVAGLNSIVRDGGIQGRKRLSCEAVEFPQCGDQIHRLAGASTTVPALWSGKWGGEVIKPLTSEVRKGS